MRVRGAVVGDESVPHDNAKKRNAKLPLTPYAPRRTDQPTTRNGNLAFRSLRASIGFVVLSSAERRSIQNPLGPPPMAMRIGPLEPTSRAWVTRCLRPPPAPRTGRALSVTVTDRVVATAHTSCRSSHRHVSASHRRCHMPEASDRRWRWVFSRAPPRGFRRFDDLAESKLIARRRSESHRRGLWVPPLY